MKRLLSVFSLIAVLILSGALAAKHQNEQDSKPSAKAWEDVTKAMSEGKPKTAIKLIDPIYEDALEQKDYPHAVKALAYKVRFQGQIEGDKPEELILRLEAERERIPAEMKPVLEALLANWYWAYYQHNSWRIMQRTAGAATDDIKTWDLRRIFQEIDNRYVASMKAKEMLRAVPVETWDLILQKDGIRTGTNRIPDDYRPTLYDFVAHQAISFYMNGAQPGSLSTDAFVLMADSPVFGTAKEFLAWEIRTTDEDSSVVKALRLMQELMRDHQNAENPSAFLDVDLMRIRFANNTAVGTDKKERYVAALERFIEEHRDHELSARAMAARAQLHYNDNERVKAYELAEQGNKAFENTPGGNECYNLMQQILAPSAATKVEHVWNAPWPSIELTYRNLTKVHFRVVKVDWEKMATKENWYWSDLNREAQLKKKPVRSWSVDLPATDDYMERVEKIPAPEDLDPGFYCLISSHDPAFKKDNNQVFYTTFRVSDLALVMRDWSGKGFLEGLVTDARLGRPVEGAVVKTWRRVSGNKKEAGPTVTTDANGIFRIDHGHNRSVEYMVLASHGGHEISPLNGARLYRSNERHRHTETMFFTDRSIYRPGQTIRFKGLCMSVDRLNNNYSAIAGQGVTVVFQDGNRKEVARQKLTANDYGSFTGSFTAPAGRGTGYMSIRVESGPRGSVGFNVEEYKRPKFKVELAKPEKAIRLNDEVTVTGKAMAYTGASIDAAQVSYRVVREVRYPDWWGWYCWWMPPAPGGSQEIAFGKAITESDGSFKVTFKAVPDLSVDRESEPVFHYTVYADITDGTGETRSAQETIRVGYTALKGTMTAEQWQEKGKPVEIAVSTTTLDGIGQAADVTVKIHRLIPPERVQRVRLPGHHPYWHYGIRSGDKPEPDLSNPNSWELGDVVDQHSLKTLADGTGSLKTELKAGFYRAVLSSKDRYGSEVKGMLPIRVVDRKAKNCVLKVPYTLTAPKWNLEPGETFVALWGSGYETARALVEIEHRGKIVRSFWTDASRTQALIEHDVTEALRGGFILHVTQIRENRAYTTSRKVYVPWSNKNLSVKWEHMVSKLEPGQKETWTAIIEGPDAESAVAEMVAAMYDKSLDAFKAHSWVQRINRFHEDRMFLRSRFANRMSNLQWLQGRWDSSSRVVNLNYRHFPHDLMLVYNIRLKGRSGGWPEGGAWFANRAVESDSLVVMDAAAEVEPSAPMTASRFELKSEKFMKSANVIAGQAGGAGGAPPASGPDLENVTARKNLNETAFFFPHLISDEDGKVRMEFTMPEALTEWRFMAFAHDRDLRSGYLEGSTVTAKDIMVQPNPPRFLRESDELAFTVKVSNLSATRQQGSVRLSFADARTLKKADGALGLRETDQAFDVPAGESRTYSWKVKVPDGMGFLQYKAVGSTGKLSDGEEGYLPVLSRRILVTESLPLPIRRPGTKKFEFTKLVKSGNSDSIDHQNLVVQMVSNPSWYAVMALPYLMEYQHDCSEQTFNRLYANALAAHIANSDPKIRRIFDLWKGTDALKSPMEKNQDLKSVMLEETPWLIQATDESEARRRVGVLFDRDRLERETAQLTRRLAEMQYNDGAWPWFAHGRPNDYITLYITTGFGRLRHLGVKGLDTAPAIKSLARLDNWVYEIHREIVKKGTQNECHLTSTIALYLYGRSFFLKDKPIDAKHREAVNYFLNQAARYWLNMPRQSQGQIAVALKRFQKYPEEPKKIMASIKEFSKLDEELGMFWRDTEMSWWWYRAPIETQAMMIEAFDEVMGDKEAVEECKVWLLKQKQTQDWKTTKATADAVYALLLRGTDLLASDELVRVSLAGEMIEPENVEAGTGFYESRFLTSEIKPEMGEIQVQKVDEGVAWGSVHWQYLEDMSKVTPYEGTPLKLQKALFTKVNTKKGKELRPVKGDIAVGDELVTRVILRVDRDMEYVHLKDQRGSGTEPVNVLSRYKYQDGLRYYESTRDTASHFFIDYLPKGTYVFEYSSRVQHRGQYQSGIASVQCMYAPEFNSHSASHVIKVK